MCGVLPSVEMAAASNDVADVLPIFCCLRKGSLCREFLQAAQNSYAAAVVAEAPVPQLPYQRQRRKLMLLCQCQRRKKMPLYQRQRRKMMLLYRCQRRKKMPLYQCQARKKMLLYERQRRKKMLPPHAPSPELASTVLSLFLHGGYTRVRDTLRHVYFR